MKQVQANLFEALYAVEANRTLMVFTIVTVVFVRLQLFLECTNSNSVALFHFPVADLVVLYLVSPLIFHLSFWS